MARQVASVIGLDRYTDRELRLELCRRQSIRKHDDDIDFGPLGAWRSFYGNLVFDTERNDTIAFRGMLLPQRDTDPMDFDSVGATRTAAMASGWSEVQTSNWISR